MDHFLQAMTLSLSPIALGAVGLGALIGIVFGSIPGLTFTVALALALPITFGMDAVPATGLLLGTYIGGMTGGSVSSILLGIPGTPSSAATVLDGYPMARQGKASLALGTAVIVSTIGGLFSLVVMILSVDVVSRIAIKFGPAEIFALVLFGMSTICGLASSSILKGLIAGIIGLMIMTVGMDAIDGVSRMTFGTINMMQGVNLLVAMIGMFAVPYVIEAFARHARGATVANETGSLKVELPSFGLMWKNSWLITRCSAIGTVIGAIPGTGGAIAAFLAYDNARRFSRTPERFGRGAIEGVIAPETANNAVTGGTLIPLLSLGIPGDPATAIVLAGLMIHGIMPGPTLFVTAPVEVYGIYISVLVAYVFILLIQLGGIRLFVHVLRIPPQLLAVGILVLCVVGVYSVRNSVFDIYTMAVIGVLAYGLQRADVPTTPIILGMVLGPILEGEYRTAMALSDGSWTIFSDSPVALMFFGLAALIVLLQAWSEFRARRPGKISETRNA